MSKTNFDDIELGTAGIEANEINSEAATAGQVLTADGVGGVGWSTPGGFVTAYSQSVLALADSSDVDWTGMGLAGVGVPVGAKAVLLAVSIEDIAGTAQINFRPDGSTWSTGMEQSPCVRTISPVAGVATLIVPCGSGEVEYKLNASGTETANAYGTLLGYWL